ncbi:hypothetical protein J2Z40_002466 [Cytobacillus eiseniae]|uniref:DUF4309 domain-containing protein n=1 Tax=Cytobacillus eiseniae TaxID=762947 RepID=A0ABS4RG56_9BACI|nr:DUF4309 domain-containing protein [Cytobacillus eiseniae]MBP2241893.1 hypothetical protein [Cytobacillus eiseniae]
MKKFIYIASLCMLTGLTACANEIETTTIKIENQNIKIDKQSQTENYLTIRTDGKEKIDLTWLKEKALYQFAAIADEQEYVIFLFAPDEQNRLSNENSTDGNKGDQLYTGHYTMFLAEKDAPFAYKQEVMEGLGELTFNASSTQVYPINIGGETVLTMINSSSKPYFYGIDSGEIKNIPMNEQILPIIGKEIKAINQKFIQSVHLYGEKEWMFTTWKFDKESMTFIKHDETVVKGNEGENWFNLWNEKKEYFFPFQNLELSSDVIDKAKQGIPLGSPYPIGTNIANIKKSDSKFLEEGTTYVMYPDITYYFDDATGIVNAVSIPGERMKTNLENIKKLFGEPAEEVNGKDGKRVIYQADKYRVELMINPDESVESIYLRKK